MAVIGLDQAGSRQEFSTCAALETACLGEAGQRFTQANNTPFLMAPLLNLLGEGVAAYGISPSTHRDFFYSPTLWSICSLVVESSMPTQLNPGIATTYIKKLPTRVAMCWESTSLLLSDIHFGHYIAGTINPIILVLNAMIANPPLLTGYSPKQWQYGLNIILEKTTGDFNVKKLCIILLFEADFNANN